ncbi:hypothetical protein ABIB99_001811 [Bradyrhizobium sp. LA6.1]|uniref:hypothetical protein n=1 Tax=Bradyrhizobium sp. LA6.1 TaxID=3156378 RepID=UPI00339604F9
MRVPTPWSSSTAHAGSASGAFSGAPRSIATTRPDLPEGCPEQFDWKLMKEAWRYDTERVPVIEAERLQYGPDVPVVRLRRDRDIQGFLESVSVHGE